MGRDRAAGHGHGDVEQHPASHSSSVKTKKEATAALKNALGARDAYAELRTTQFQVGSVGQ
jgi:hypothetical protein